MWASLPAKVQARLTAGSRNGTANGLPAAGAGPRETWDSLVVELADFRGLADDYDGEGAVAPSPAVVESAVELARVLARDGVAPPACVVPGVNGTANLEWDLGGRESVTIEVTGLYTAEVFLLVPDAGKAEHWVLAPALTVP